MERWFLSVRVSGFCLSVCCPVPAAKRHGIDQARTQDLSSASSLEIPFSLSYSPLIYCLLFFLLPVCREWAWSSTGCMWCGVRRGVFVVERATWSGAGAVDFVVSIAFGV